MAFKASSQAASSWRSSGSQILIAVKPPPWGAQQPSEPNNFPLCKESTYANNQGVPQPTGRAPVETKDSTSGATLLLQLCFLVAIARVMTGKSGAIIKPQMPCVQSTEDGTYVFTTHSGRFHRRGL